MNWMMLCKLPLGASLWAILFFFIFTACQDDAPYKTTEVIMTFTTRALVTQDNATTPIDVERMKDLRVIMVRENGYIAHNHKIENITTNSVTISFQTLVNEGGERFKFFAIANEGGITPTQNFSAITESAIPSLNTLSVGDGEFAIPNNQAIPQTSYWTHDVDLDNPETKYVSAQLDYTVGKITLQFDNKKNSSQHLENIYITGITPNTQGFLFKQAAPDYITTNDFNGNIVFDDIDVQAGSPSSIQHYYTYPIGFISQQITKPILHATWNGTEYSLELPGVSSLLRGQRLDIVVTLDQGLAVNFSIKDWEVNNTNIGSSPNVGGNYGAGDWTDQDIDINGGDDPVGPDVPVVPGDVYKGSFTVGDIINYIDISGSVDKLVTGATLAFEIECNQNGSNWEIRFMANEWTNNLEATDDGYLRFNKDVEALNLVLTATDVANLKASKRLYLVGANVTIKRISIK